jgi:hypothetical protein
VHVRRAGIKQAADVAAQQLPREEVCLVTVVAIDDESAYATGFQHRLEGVEILHVFEQVLALIVGQRLVGSTVVVAQRSGRIRGVARERVRGRVVSHISTLVPLSRR